MSIEVVTALLSSVAPAIAAKLWEAMRERLRERGVQEIPGDVGTIESLRQAQAVLSEHGERLAPDEAYTLTLEALAAAHSTANGLRAERLRQAKATFNAALALAVIGVLIIFVGVGLLLFRDAVTAGALTAGIGAVTEVISAVLFKFNHETNNRLDEIGKDLSSIQAAQIAMTLITKIEDPSKRDDAIREAAKDLRAYGAARKA